MRRRVTAHDLAEYARCPRAWWLERHESLARLDAEALEARLQARRAALGRRARGDDPELQLIVRLLARQTRYAHGRAVHRLDAARPRGVGCLPAVALLALTLALLLWR